MSTTITNFFTFDTQAEEAAKLYTSLFGGTITQTMRYPKGGPKPEGSVLSVTFQLLGQTFIALNGGPSFGFSPGFSLMVQVDTQSEIDRLWDKLLEGGGKPAQVPKVMQVIHSERDTTAELDASRVDDALRVVEQGLRAWDHQNAH